jgi:hypothetical protein
VGVLPIVQYVKGIPNKWIREGGISLGPRCHGGRATVFSPMFLVRGDAHESISEISSGGMRRTGESTPVYCVRRSAVSSRSSTSSSTKAFRASIRAFNASTRSWLKATACRMDGTWAGSGGSLLLSRWLRSRGGPANEGSSAAALGGAYVAKKREEIRQPRDTTRAENRTKLTSTPSNVPRLQGLSFRLFRHQPLLFLEIRDDKEKESVSENG